MNELKIFEHPKFGNIRTADIDGEPWFVGKDVATALGYADPNKAVMAHVDADDKLNDKTALSLGQRGGWFINESGLYSLVLSSKLPEAKAFKRWITHEVIPSIRRTGGYLVGQEDMTPEELMAKALVWANKQLEDRNARISALETSNSALKVENEIMAPKAGYFDQLVDRNLLTSLRETAKLLEVKERDFIQFLLDHKYLYRDKRGHLMPYAQHVENGIFVVKECFNEKTQWKGTQTMVTPKGRETFRLLFIGV